MRKSSSVFLSLLAILFILTTAICAENTKVLLETNYGDIKVELYDDLTPVTVANFLDYVNGGFYDGIIFHRVMDNFMIQTGIYTSDLYEADFAAPDFDLYDPSFTKSPGDTIVDEFVNELQNVRGTLAMANTGQPSTGSSQIFINHNSSGNHHLDGKHTVFGEVIEGMDVVDIIAGIDHYSDPDMPGYLANLPFEPIVIEQALVISDDPKDPNDPEDPEDPNVPDYSLLEYDLFSGDGALELVNEQNERIQILLDGSGELVVSVTQVNETELVRSIDRVQATDTTGKTKIIISNLDNPGNVHLDEFSFERSLDYLACGGTIDTIVGDPNSKQSVDEFIVGGIKEIYAPGCRVGSISVDDLGDPNQNTAQNGYLRVNMVKVRDITVSHDMHNIVFFDSQSRNVYRNVYVGGVMNNSALYGLSLKKLTVANENQVENALDYSGIFLSNFINHITVNYGNVANGSYILAEKKISNIELINGDLQGSNIEAETIGRLVVRQGHIDNCNINASKKILKLELLNGNIEDSTIETDSANRSKIYWVTVSSANHVMDDPNSGNIINSSISSHSLIKYVHADGQIDQDTIIKTNSSINMVSVIDTISSGGDCGATISSRKVNKVLVGVNQAGKRLDEVDGFTGSDFTGSIYGLISVKTVMATGKIGIGSEPSTAASIVSYYGSVTSLFAEDGFNASVSAGTRVNRIMVGFVNGFRRKLANATADVAGEVNANRLSRLYYTGQKDDEMTLPDKSPIVKHVN